MNASSCIANIACYQHFVSILQFSQKEEETSIAKLPEMDLSRFESKQIKFTKPNLNFLKQHSISKKLVLSAVF